jgi:hypothetical protein
MKKLPFFPVHLGKRGNCYWLKKQNIQVRGYPPLGMLEFWNIEKIGLDYGSSNLEITARNWSGST